MVLCALTVCFHHPAHEADNISSAFGGTHPHVLCVVDLRVPPDETYRLLGRQDALPNAHRRPCGQVAQLGCQLHHGSNADRGAHVPALQEGIQAVEDQARLLESCQSLQQQLQLALLLSTAAQQARSVFLSAAGTLSSPKPAEGLLSLALSSSGVASQEANLELQGQVAGTQAAVGTSKLSWPGGGCLCVRCA